MSTNKAKMVKVMGIPNWKNPNVVHLHITIPKAYAQELGWKKGDPLFVYIQDGKLVYEKVKGNE